MEEWSKQILPNHQIFLLNDFLTDDFCNKVRKYIDKSIEDKKTSTERHAPGSNVMSETLYLCKSNPEQTELDKSIYDVISKLIKLLVIDFGLKISSDSGYQLRRINGPTRRHADGIIYKGVLDPNNKVDGNNIRVMTVIFGLNDDYDGGELCFPEQNVMIKLKKGQIIAFPPYWTHPHYTNDLKNNTHRYTINTWLRE